MVVSCFVPRLTAKAVAVLLPILGISWIFGVLAFNTHSLPFLYIFAVFNSLQVRAAPQVYSFLNCEQVICECPPKIYTFLFYF